MEIDGQVVEDDFLFGAISNSTSVGGILTLQFDEQGNLFMNVTSEEDDFFFDEIGSVLKIKQIQSEKRELLGSLELYYRVMFLGEDGAALLEEE